MPSRFAPVSVKQQNTVANAFIGFFQLGSGAGAFTQEVDPRTGRSVSFFGGLAAPAPVRMDPNDPWELGDGEAIL